MTDLGWHTNNILGEWTHRVADHGRPILLPRTYGIGTTFFANPATAQPDDYTTLCDNLRLDFYILMQRLYAIFHQAFSDRDKEVKGNTWGAIPVDYIARQSNNPQHRYLTTRLTTTATGREVINSLKQRGADRSKFLENAPAFLKVLTEQPDYLSFFELCVAQIPHPRDWGPQEKSSRESFQQVFFDQNIIWKSRRKDYHDRATLSEEKDRRNLMQERDLATSPTKKTGNPSNPIDLLSPLKSAKSIGGDGSDPSLLLVSRPQGNLKEPPKESYPTSNQAASIPIPDPKQWDWLFTECGFGLNEVGSDGDCFIRAAAIGVVRLGKEKQNLPQSKLHMKVKKSTQDILLDTNKKKGEDECYPLTRLSRSLGIPHGEFDRVVKLNPTHLGRGYDR